MLIHHTFKNLFSYTSCSGNYQFGMLAALEHKVRAAREYSIPWNVGSSGTLFLKRLQLWNTIPWNARCSGTLFFGKPVALEQSLPWDTGCFEKISSLERGLLLITLLGTWAALEHSSWNTGYSISLKNFLKRGQLLPMLYAGEDLKVKTSTLVVNKSC